MYMPDCELSTCAMVYINDFYSIQELLALNTGANAINIVAKPLGVAKPIGSKLT
jgi:hypothetical protein